MTLYLLVVITVANPSIGRVRTGLRPWITLYGVNEIYISIVGRSIPPIQLVPAGQASPMVYFSNVLWEMETGVLVLTTRPFAKVLCSNYLERTYNTHDS